MHGLSHLNTLAFILENGIVNENQVPLEMYNHRSLIKFYMDESEQIAAVKCAQIGGSTAKILKAIHLCRYRDANVIYTLPSRSVVKDFVSPKVDPLIASNPAIEAMIGKTDSTALKQIGNRFLYFRGSWEPDSAISISAHALINDEVDRCLVPDTEVLTKDGWKKIQDIKITDKVATRHPVHHNMSFKHPVEIIKQEYDGDIYIFKGHSFEIRTTANHRVFVKRLYDLGYGFCPAAELIGKQFAMTAKSICLNRVQEKAVKIPYLYATRRARFTGKIQPLEYKARQVPATAWFTFLGWYISEGCLGIGKNSKNFKRAVGSIIISQKQEVYVKEIVEVVKALGYTPKVYTQKSEVKQIVFSDLQLALYLQRHVGTVYTKRIPKRWLWYHPKLIKCMLESLIKGDGDDRNVYTTVSRQLADDVYTLAIRLGFNASIYRSKHVYKVGIVVLPYRMFNGKKGSNTKTTVLKEPYKGMVYCLSLPNESFMIRYKDNHAVWTGNSNPKTLKTFKTRLDAARMERPDLGFVWQFSNPSIPGNGVDEPYQESDKKHWFIKCHTCNYEWYMMYPDNIDFVRKIYICTKCRNELTDEDRRRGRWVQKHTGRDISGYWFNQMMMPWIPAKKIIADSKGDPQIFHNFTLGMPFINKNQQLTRSALVRCISPDENPQIGNAIGVDVGVVKHYVIGNRYGIFKVGRTESWEEIESLRNRYAAVMVIDALPFPHEPRRMVASYPGKVFMHYFSKDKQRTEIIHWGEHEKDGIVESDRTKIIDAVTADIMAEDIIFNMTHAEMELFINHCLALYRTTRETRQGSREGVVVPVWETIDNKDDHYFFALTYFKIALEKATISSAIINTRPIVEKLSSPVGDLHGTPHIQDDIMADIKSMQQKAGHDWR